MYFEEGKNNKEVDFDLLFDGAPLSFESCNRFSQIFESIKMIIFDL